MWGYMGNYGWGGMGFGMIGMALFWILLLVAIVAVVRGTWGSGTAAGKQPQGKTALDIVKERYARGEIEKTEFEQKKLDLSA